MLTYEAMSNSDDIVLVLERGTGAQANDASIIGANDAFRRASGYSNEQVLDHAVADFFQSGNHAETLMNAVRGNGSLRGELACSRADGGSFMLGMHLMPAPARTPGRDCFVILGRDITAALEARQMQDSIQRLLAKVFSSVDAAVAIINSGGRVVMTNPGIDLLLGYKPNGLVGRVSIELVAPGSRTLVAATLKQHIKDGGTTTYSAPFLRMDGSELLLRITSVTAATGDAKQFRIVTLRPEAPAMPRVRSESVGRIKLVGLEEVRTALGDRWPAAAERAMATAETVIKRHCGPQDSFSRADDISFLMCFGSLNEEESSFRAAMIGREIRTKLIGEGQDPENAQVRALAAVVRFPDQDESGTELNAVLLDGLDQQMERIEREARQTLANAMTSTVFDVEPAYGRAPAEMVASQVFIPPKLERELHCALSALPLKESQAFDLDGFLLGLAAQHAVASMARGDITPVLVRISFDVFATRVSTERFFGFCAKIDRRVTARLVVLLSSLPSGLPRSRLQDCVNRLRPFCRGVGYQVDDAADLPEIDLTNSSNPIVVLPVAACGASTPAKLRVLFTSLQTRRAKVLIRGVGSEKDAAALRALGVDMVAMKRQEAA